MAWRALVLPLVLVVLLLLVLLVLPPPPVLVLPPPGNASPPACPPDRFQCAPGARCFPRDWLCDGHPDCEDEGDEWDCATATAVEPSPAGARATPPWGSAVPPTGSAEASAAPGDSVPARSQGCLWILVVAVLLSILVAAGSIAVWGFSKAKTRPDVFRLEKTSREQLVPDKSQTGSFPQGDPYDEVGRWG
ncbi:CD320 antigen isoform X1 [Falco biarmicus]|uniref:CD320 antigen isoform X1 n=1 Tax=Falco biarmicus TaxID=345155 RepID=UPI0024BCC32E|nr:CD320 antigen isoform X1 [Falco biarmicus]